MDTAVWKTMLYGFVSGLAEFLPISSRAHESILLRLLGDGATNAFADLFVHMGTLACLIVLMRAPIARIRRERRLQRTPKRRRRREPDMLVLLDGALVRTAAVPILIGAVLHLALRSRTANLPVIAVFLLLNGIVLYLPSRLPSGNKDARAMTRLDAVLIGACGALSVCTGISRMAMTTSVSLIRGADRQKALHWSLLLSIPALAALCVTDLVRAVSLTEFSAAMLLAGILGAAAAFAGAYIAVTFMRFMAYGPGFSGFAYYCWGAALFTFVLYMI